jgi:acyl homoserine lactone synthase
MLHYIYADQLHLYPTLRDTMFRDRAEQFSRRLGWAVTVDEQGWERDQYDALNPLYVIWEREDGTHGGSMRLLPTTGRTMVAEHFADVADISGIVSPFVWECTRFCLAPGAEPRVVAALVLACDEVMERFCLTHLLAVFDARMVRVYRRMGTSPEVLGSSGSGRDMIAVGLWERGGYDEEDRIRVREKAGLVVVPAAEGREVSPEVAAHLRAPEAKVALAA